MTEQQFPVCCQHHNSHQPVISHDRFDHRFHGLGIAWTIGSAAECKHTIREAAQSGGGIFIRIIHGWLSEVVTNLGGNGKQEQNLTESRSELNGQAAITAEQSCSNISHICVQHILITGTQS